MRISEDKKLATLEVLDTYRADELEALIVALSELRSQMLPEVPKSPGLARVDDDPAAARAGGDPCVQVSVMRDGLTRFWVRHSGLGWFGFNLPVERAHTLARYILGLSTPPAEAREFFGRKRRESDSCH